MRDPSKFYDATRHRRLMPKQDLSETDMTDLIAFLDWISNIDNQGCPSRPIPVKGASLPGRDLAVNQHSTGDAGAVKPNPPGARPIAGNENPIALGEKFFRSATPACTACHSVAPHVNEGVWKMIQGEFLACLLIRPSGADREVMEKWLHVIVSLVFIAGILGTARHYYRMGVPSCWLPIGYAFNALEPLALVGMAMYAYSAIRRSGLTHPNKLALQWNVGNALFTLFGACLPGLDHTFSSVNKWTHGTLITAMQSHAAFYGAYAMIVLAMITYALPAVTRRPEKDSAIGCAALWMQIAGMFGIAPSFATAGVGQV